MSFVLPTADQKALDEEAARILGLRGVHVESIRARPITFTEVAAFVDGDADDFTGYVRDEAGFLCPATFSSSATRRARLRGVDREPVYGFMPNPKPRGPEVIADRDTVVGYAVRVDAVTVFGHVVELTLYTSSEAEESARVLSEVRHAAEGRERCFVDDDEAGPVPLVPVYGSQATVSLVVADATPEDVRERIERALREEFGETLGALMKVRTRPVANRRVDVYSEGAEERTPLALGILSAEVSLVREGGAMLHVEAHNPRRVPIVGS